MRLKPFPSEAIAFIGDLIEDNLVGVNLWQLIDYHLEVTSAIVGPFFQKC